jgi:predicted Zn-dependent peptidase
MLEDLVLNNGIKVLLKNIPSSTCVSLGFFTLVSLEEEPNDLNGIAHFLEHMSFKGTAKRSAKKIALELDIMGGHMNAYTGKEYTCYYVTVTPQNLLKSFELLSDLFLNSTLAASDIKTEKKVVLEEINSYEDTPDELIHDIFCATIWQNNKLGLPILGTKGSLEKINQKNLNLFKNNYLDPHKLIISIAGNIPNSTKLLAKINASFGHIKPVVSPKKSLVPKVHPNISVKYKDTEQINLCLGTKGIPYDHEHHSAVSVLNNILGSTMSSRLFQKIREKKGYAYSIYSYPLFYKNAGLFVIYAGINKDCYQNTLKLIIDELTKMKNFSSKSELSKAKSQIKSGLAIQLEQSVNYMSVIAKHKIYYNKIFSFSEIAAKIDKVNIEDIQFLANSFFTKENLSLASIGPFSKADLAWGNKKTYEYLAQNKIRL